MAVEREEAILNQYVAEQLKQQRELRGISQSNLARLLGVNIIVIQKAEAGVERIAAHSLYEACQVFGISLRSFFRDYTDALKAETPPDQHRHAPEKQGAEWAQT